MSNLLEKASIILTPTAYNDGEALCVKPTDGSGDFDFSRNSAATRVNAQGLVENVQIRSGNLVQNGDFSEEGAEEVSNGSFSQEGGEPADDSVISNAGGSIMTKVSALNYNATSDGAGGSTVRPRLLFNNITLGKKYRIWPSYDFSVAIEDSIDGVTHAFRSKEFELRKELIDAILDALNMRKPAQDFFSRLELKDIPITKRIIQPHIEEARVQWNYDNRVTT